MPVRDRFRRQCSRAAALIFAWLCVISAACAPNPRAALSPETSGPAPEAAAPEAIEVRVMSFNIRNGRANDGENRWDMRKELVCDVIRECSPDVLGIQEAYRFQLDEFNMRLPEYAEVGVGRDGASRGEHSSVLFLKKRFDIDESGTFWLSDTPAKPSAHWGNRYRRICTWARLVEKAGEGPGDAALYIFNTHLDHRSQPSREKGVRLIAERIATRAHPDPVVVTGDMNAGERNPAVRFLLEEKGEAGETGPARLVDSYRVLHPEEKAVGTFHWFTGLAPGGKIDYVLVPPDAEVLDAQIVRASREGRFPSDHFPVTARVRLVPRGDATRRQ